MVLLLRDTTRYRHLVGSLVYLTVTRPDIAHAVHIVSQFVSAPTSVHYDHLLRVLRYLRGTSSRRLHYVKALINFSFMLILTQLGRVILLIVALSPVIVSFLALLSLHVFPRNKHFSF